MSFVFGQATCGCLFFKLLNYPYILYKEYPLSVKSNYTTSNVFFLHLIDI